MSELISISARSRRRHRPHRRWSTEEKAQFLDAFRQSGLSGEAFCRKTGVPRATFAIWKREARRAASEAVAFARVEVVPTPVARAPIGEARAGIRLVVRGAAGDGAALDGVDGVTAVHLVALILGRR